MSPAVVRLHRQAALARQAANLCGMQSVDWRLRAAEAERRVERLRAALDAAAENGMSPGCYEYLQTLLLRSGDWRPRVEPIAHFLPPEEQELPPLLVTGRKRDR